VKSRKFVITGISYTTGKIKEMILYKAEGNEYLSPSNYQTVYRVDGDRLLTCKPHCQNRTVMTDIKILEVRRR